MEPGNFSINKKSKFNGEEGDKISDLPEPVIHHILSFLDMKHAVQTSLLSKRWRYVWTSLPTLNFNCDLFSSIITRLGTERSNLELFKEFVSQVFILRDDSSNIQRFRLSCHRVYSPCKLANLLHTCILIALRRDVEEIYLEISEEIRLPNFLFTSKSLRVLELKYCGNPRYKFNVPGLCLLAGLKTLILQSVIFEGDDVPNKLFSSCPELELLSITNCVFHQDYVLNITNLTLKNLVIENSLGVGVQKHIKLFVPNLISFRCKDFMSTNYSVENLSSLVKAEINLNIEKHEVVEFRKLDSEMRKMYAKRMLKFLSGLHNVEDLKLSSRILEVFTVPPRLVSPPSRFCNLRSLKLETEITSNSLLGIIKLLVASPKIESLLLEAKEEIYKTQPPSHYWEELRFVDKKLDYVINKGLPLHMVNHLKFIEFRGVHGRASELLVMGFLLKHAPVLEKMVAYASKENSPHRERWLTSFTEKLLTLPRASSNIAIVFI